MALLHSNWLYVILPLFYFTPLHSTLLYHGSTSLYFILHYNTIAVLHSSYSTKALLQFTWLYIALPWLYFTLPDSMLLYHCSTPLHFNLHYSIMALLHSSSLYFTLLHSTLLYHSCTSLYLLQHGSISLYMTLYCCIMVLCYSTSLYITLPWLYFTLRRPTLH